MISKVLRAGALISAFAALFVLPARVPMPPSSEPPAPTESKTWSYEEGVRDAEASWERGDAVWMSHGYGPGPGPAENYGLRCVTLGCVTWPELLEYSRGHNNRLAELLAARGIGRNGPVMDPHRPEALTAMLEKVPGTTFRQPDGWFAIEVRGGRLVVSGYGDLVSLAPTDVEKFSVIWPHDPAQALVGVWRDGRLVSLHRVRAAREIDASTVTYGQDGKARLEAKR